MSDEQIEILAKKAKQEENNDLAIVLHVYLGAKHSGLTSDFARHCQVWAKAGAEWIKLEQKINKIRKNN